MDILATFAKKGLDLRGKLMSSVRMSAPMAWTPVVARPRMSAARAGCGAAMVARLTGPGLSSPGLCLCVVVRAVTWIHTVTPHTAARCALVRGARCRVTT